MTRLIRELCSVAINQWSNENRIVVHPLLGCVVLVKRPLLSVTQSNYHRLHRHGIIIL